MSPAAVAGLSAPSSSVLVDAAYLLASSWQDYEAIAVMKALTRFFERLREEVSLAPVQAAPLSSAEIARR